VLTPKTNVIELRGHGTSELAAPADLRAYDDARHRHMALAPETINLRVIRPNFAIVHVRLAGGLHLRSMGAKRGPNGSVRLSFPRIVGRNGTDHGFAYALPPGQREQPERATGALWAQIITPENEGNAL
jgi:hypothetical protein